MESEVHPTLLYAPSSPEIQLTPRGSEQLASVNALQVTGHVLLSGGTSQEPSLLLTPHSPLLTLTSPAVAPRLLPDLLTAHRELTRTGARKNNGQRPEP